MTGIRTESRDGVLSITLDKPEKLNALNADMLEVMAEALAAAQRPGSDVAVILLTGAGRSFCAGADREAMAQFRSEAEISRHAYALKSVLLVLAEGGLPVITAVQGHALGAGCGLVTASTVVIAAENAQFGYPELATGVIPALVTPLLARAVGARRALALALTSQRISATQALAWGLITGLCDHDPRPAAQLMAARLATQSSRTVEGLMRLVDASGRMPLADVLEEAARFNIEEKIRRQFLTSSAINDTCNPDTI